MKTSIRMHDAISIANHHWQISVFLYLKLGLQLDNPRIQNFAILKTMILGFFKEAYSSKIHLLLLAFETLSFIIF